MASFIFSPNWFFGIDVTINLFSFITLMLISIFSYKFYKLDTERKTPFYLAMSFGVLAMSYLVLFGTYTLIYYYQFLSLQNIEIVAKTVAVTIGGTRFSYWLFSVGVAFYHFLSLTGLYMLYCIYQKRFIKADSLIVLSSFFILTYFSHNSYSAYHLMAFILLGLISHIYYLKYQQNGKRTTQYLMLGFMSMAASQSIFIFKTLNNLFYVLAQGIQLVGLILLLFSVIKVFKHGKKKK